MIDGSLIERLADAAWPAEDVQPLGPWKLRATRGVSRRANSVFTVGQSVLGPRDLDRLIDAAELFYAERMLPPCFYLSPYSTPPALENALIRRGYIAGQTVQVWTASVTELAATIGVDPGEPRCADQPDDGWFDCAFNEPAPQREIHEAIVHRVPAPRCFASMLVEGVAASCGLSVSAAGYTGIFCMATREPYRRRGLATAVLRQLITWAAARPDRWVYLQVLSNNLPAQGVYRRIGMTRLYDYHYRAKLV